jgi:hypothetical protein
MYVQEDQMTGLAPGRKISRENLRLLTWLRMHWEGLYQISLEDGDVWQAVPRWDDRDILTSGSARTLLGTMKDHYAYYASSR